MYRRCIVQSNVSLSRPRDFTVDGNNRCNYYVIMDLFRVKRDGGKKRRWPTASRGPRRTKVYGCVRLRRRGSNFTLSLHNPGCEYNTRRVFIFHGRIHRSCSNDHIESNFISVIPVNEKEERENANKRGISVSYDVQVRDFLFFLRNSLGNCLRIETRFQR